MDQRRFEYRLSRFKLEIPGLVAAGFIDLDSGDWIALESTGPHPKEFLSYLAATTQAYFEGDAVRTIKTVLDEATDSPHPPREIEEIIIRSSGHFHFLQRLEDEPRVALGIVTTREPKLGLVRAVVKQVLEEPIDEADALSSARKRRDFGTMSLEPTED